jgi:hypothetical protein
MRSTLKKFDYGLRGEIGRRLSALVWTFDELAASKRRPA